MHSFRNGIQFPAERKKTAAQKNHKKTKENCLCTYCWHVRSLQENLSAACVRLNCWKMEFTAGPSFRLLFAKESGVSFLVSAHCRHWREGSCFRLRSQQTSEPMELLNIFLIDGVLSLVLWTGMEQGSERLGFGRGGAIRPLHDQISVRVMLC